MKKTYQLKWGIIGNSRIGKYSVAPVMWKALFKKLDIPIKYFIISSNNRQIISHKINILKKDNDFIGANVAVPWKKTAYDLCDKSHLFDKLKVVNIILKNNKNELIGYNSDGMGLIESIKKCTFIKGKNIVLFGSGGSAQTIPLHLLKNGAKKLYVNDVVSSKATTLVSIYSPLFKREKASIRCFSRNDIENRIKKADILINATPCGMVGYRQRYPFNKKFIKKMKKTCFVIDTVYNPQETPLLKKAKNYGNLICEGYNMLIEQAAVSFSYAFGFELNDSDKETMKKIIIKEYEKQ